MVVSTMSYKEASKKRYRALLGVDDYDFEYHANVEDKEMITIYSGYNFMGKSNHRVEVIHPIVFHWWLNGTKYSAILPTVKKTINWGNLFSGGYKEGFDEETMFKEAKRLVEESRK